MVLCAPIVCLVIACGMESEPSVCTRQGFSLATDNAHFVFGNGEPSPS